MFISEAAAESVAFVGRAVRLLRSPGGEFEGDALLPHTDCLEFAQVRVCVYVYYIVP